MCSGEVIDDEVAFSISCCESVELEFKVKPARLTCASSYLSRKVFASLPAFSTTKLTFAITSRASLSRSSEVLVISSFAHMTQFHEDVDVQFLHMFCNCFTPYCRAICRIAYASVSPEPEPLSRLDSPTARRHAAAFSGSFSQSGSTRLGIGQIARAPASSPFQRAHKYLPLIESLTALSRRRRSLK